MDKQVKQAPVSDLLSDLSDESDEYVHFRNGILEELDILML